MSDPRERTIDGQVAFLCGKLDIPASGDSLTPAGSTGYIRGALEDTYDAATHNERAVIVEWLRLSVHADSDLCEAAPRIADAIEAGEHLK